MVLTGKVSLWMTAVVLLGVRTVPGTKLRVLKGRRGPSEPGPGSVLLIRWARCKWKPRAPRYPISRVVFASRVFSTCTFHCWTYSAGAWGSKAVKHTVVG